MGLFNHFPYPDTHQLNLDWILDAVKTCVDKVAELWTYVREPGAGIQKALTDAQAAATTAQASATSAQTSATGAQASAASAQTSATSAQASSANARTSAISAEANAANAQTSANDAQESADDASSSVDLCHQYLTDAQAAATTAQTSAQSAQAAATTAQASEQSTQASATSAQTSAQNAQKSATSAEEAVSFIPILLKQTTANIYPVGSVYVNYRNQEMPVENDETVIARLQDFTGGKWERAGSHGQPVTKPERLGWAIGTLGNAAGDANDFNFNIYVRTE